MNFEPFVIVVQDAEGMRSLGKSLAQSLSPGSVLLLEGDLGSGKTTLVQGIGEGLGITDPIVSPTFTLINEYPEGRIPLYHLDLYRLEPQEVAALNLETYWEGVEFPWGIVAIEWAERLPYKPQSYLQICLTYLASCTNCNKPEAEPPEPRSQDDPGNENIAAKPLVRPRSQVEPGNENIEAPPLVETGASYQTYQTDGSRQARFIPVGEFNLEVSQLQQRNFS